MPSHKMMSFCFLLVREGGRNSATISFLNRVRNMMSELSPRPWPVVCEGQLLAPKGITNRPRRGGPRQWKSNPRWAPTNRFPSRTAFITGNNSPPGIRFDDVPNRTIAQGCSCYIRRRFSLTKRILGVGRTVRSCQRHQFRLESKDQHRIGSGPVAVVQPSEPPPGRPPPVRITCSSGIF